jgi:diguanylate cyclase (GGDEF)-like protein/PAS domain S-box-containing protein
MTRHDDDPQTTPPPALDAALGPGPAPRPGPDPGHAAVPRSRTGVAFHLAVFASTVAFFVVAGYRDPVELFRPVYLLWVIPMAVVSLFPITGESGTRVGLDFPLSMTVAALYAPASAALITFVGSFDPREIRRTVPVSRALFNRSQVALATAAASGVFHVWATADSSFVWIGLAALPAVPAAYVVNVALVTTAMSLDFGVTIRQVVSGLRVEGTDRFLLGYLALGYLGMLLAGAYARLGNLTLLALLGPLLLARQLYVRGRILANTTRDLSGSLQRMRRLHAISDALERVRNPAELARTLANGLVELTGQHRFVVFLGEVGALAAVASAGPVGGEGGGGPVADLARRCLGSDGPSRRPDAPPWSSIAVPLRSGGTVVGAVVGLAAEGSAFDRSDDDLIEVLSSRTAVAIGNARLLDEARAAADRYRALVEQLPAVTYTEAADGALTYVSPQIETLTGRGLEAFRSDRRTWIEMVHPDDRAAVTAAKERSRREGSPFTSEYRLVAGDGRTLWAREGSVPIPATDSAPAHREGVLFDISDRKAAEDRLEFLAYHDPLTELPNRALFSALLEKAIARARRVDAAVAVLSVDLDHLKLVNDALGHDAGDQLLRETASRLRVSVRDADVVARVGGDEFLVLLPDLPMDRPGRALAIAEGLARRIQQDVHQPLVLGGAEFDFSTSVGISIYPLDAEDAASLVRNADAAMYQSKRLAPGRYAVFSSLSSAAQESLRITTRLRRAVREARWELHYQPIVDLFLRRWVSVEALVRWRDVDRTLRPPAEFIPLAEETGVIDEITRWVVGAMARDLASWRSTSATIDATFNLSPRELWQPTLVPDLRAQLDANGVEPGWVTIEITESGIVMQPETVLRTLHALHGEGFRIAIDDFGTGHSSLARLTELPADVVKLDRSLVRDLPGSSAARSIAKATIQMLNSLGLVPLAEGIETEAQATYLAELGCPLGQGFLFAEPIPASEVASSLRLGAAPESRPLDPPA